MRIGLTGGIAAGKSTVARRWERHGAVVIDYDLLAREAVEPGGEALPAIVETFGPQTLRDGRLDRAWLAGCVFGPDAQALRRLNDIVHPVVYRLAAQREREALSSMPGAASGCDNRPIVVHDVPLLAEVMGRIPFRFDHIVTVEAPAALRVRRMVSERGMDEGQAWARIRHQASEGERRAIADALIDSTRPLDRMYDDVDTLVAAWRRT